MNIHYFNYYPNLIKQKSNPTFKSSARMDINLTEGRQIIGADGQLHKTNMPREWSRDSKESIEVAQGEYSVAEYSSRTPSLQTYGIGPCVALTIYDKESKQGFLAHIDSPQKAKSLHEILPQLLKRGFDANNCEARIIGGTTSNHSSEIIKNIQKNLNEADLKIVETDILGKSTRNIQLDLNTGNVTDYGQTIQSRPDISIVAWNLMYRDTLTEYCPPKQ